MMSFTEKRKFARAFLDLIVENFDHLEFYYDAISKLEDFDEFNLIFNRETQDAIRFARNCEVLFAVENFRIIYATKPLDLAQIVESRFDFHRGIVPQVLILSICRKMIKKFPQNRRLIEDGMTFVAKIDTMDKLFIFNSENVNEDFIEAVEYYRDHSMMPHNWQWKRIRQECLNDYAKFFVFSVHKNLTKMDEMSRLFKEICEQKINREFKDEIVRLLILHSRKFIAKENDPTAPDRPMALFLFVCVLHSIDLIDLNTILSLIRYCEKLQNYEVLKFISVALKSKFQWLIDPEHLNEIVLVLNGEQICKFHKER
jgi:hypothetical protein